MAKRRITKAEVSKSSRADDIAVVERALDLIERIPPWDPALGSTAERGRIHLKFKEDIKPLYGVLERLQAEFIPEAQFPSPLACTIWTAGSGTPVTNLIGCFDLCVHCHGEAKRGLRVVRDGLLGKPVVHPFLPPEELAARVHVSTARVHSDEQRTRDSMARLADSARIVGALLSTPDTGRGAAPVPEATRSQTNRPFVLHLGQSTRAELDGEIHPLTTEQARIVDKLARAGGAWVPEDRLKKDSASSENPGETIKLMPEPIRALIESKTGPGGGRRLRRIPTIEKESPP